MKITLGLSFTVAWVYIPGGLVEVVGVIDDLDYPLEDILKYGQGAFLHQSSPRVKVLEVKKTLRFKCGRWKEGVP